MLSSAPATARTVLCVEDNVSNVKLLERILARRPEVTVMVAMLGGPALELAREHQPSLVLLDLRLPDMSGEEILRRLRAELRTAGIPVVVLGADATPGPQQRLLGAGAAARAGLRPGAGRSARPADAARRRRTTARTIHPRGHRCSPPDRPQDRRLGPVSKRSSLPMTRPIRRLGHMALTGVDFLIEEAVTGAATIARIDPSDTDGRGDSRW